MKLCFATNNANKLQEIQAMLGQEFKLVTLEQIGCYDDIPEPYETISENSVGKARYVWENFGINCFADDTGLEVEALGGEPGVMSARYAGPQRMPDDNMNLLLQNLAPFDDRSARFITVITLCINGDYQQFEGTINGTIISEKRGDQGFGYDPVFMPEGFEVTFAQMSMQEKAALSHRGRAFAKLVEFLKDKQEN
ncbi:RdgB/HAM1 family non-canonical purine NTP pyrophosphatase [Dyadobacter sandarakinus]|uniref:dITP/XTP pyrophosphatase n=1 Tax=Dyadobacter sandarakinus TaxID=2747268 RepID=A0ABX7I844_9BACT|nr:RdgB/HAM1 family non-canonical purine NTP pyrophosphatase [Dyadobacter sandarakinus]QRR02276.1 RdgB/HAM1 family non-canonical purine NTP pyrophosphatase [Dyadobacter sandarakinus]